jgi:hypothetical protein
VLLGTIRKVQVNQVGLKLNGTHQLLVYADVVNLLGDNIDIVKLALASLTSGGSSVGIVRLRTTSHGV